MTKRNLAGISLGAIGLAAILLALGIGFAIDEHRHIDWYPMVLIVGLAWLGIVGIVGALIAVDA